MPRLRRHDDEEEVGLEHAPASGSPAPALSSLGDLAGADPETRALVLARLQQGAGNASVARIVARQPVADAAIEELEREAMVDAVVAPHEGGDESDGVRIAEEAGAVTAAPSPTNAAPTTPTLATWAATVPADNPAFAKWILDGEAHGFVEFLDFRWMMKKGQDAVEFSPKLQMEAIVNGDTIVLADGSAGAPVLGALKSIYGIVKARADRWQGDQSKPKDKLEVGWVVRDDRSTGMRGHTFGESADLRGGYDWTGAAGPAQVMQTLDDLASAWGAGNYGIGLPFQGQFFPGEEEMVGRVNAALAEAGKDGTPRDLTEPPSLVRYSPKRRGLKWDPDHKPNPRYVVTSEPADAVTRLKSAALKTKIADLRRTGVVITVFPDNNSHIHITKA